MKYWWEHIVDTFLTNEYNEGRLVRPVSFVAPMARKGGSGMYTLGIDIGSTTSKCAILQDGTELVAKSLQRGGLGTGGPGEALNELTLLRNLALERLLARTQFLRLALHALAKEQH